MLMLDLLYIHLLPIFPTFFFFFNDTATTDIYTLPLHDALPISARSSSARIASPGSTATTRAPVSRRARVSLPVPAPRSSTVRPGRRSSRSVTQATASARSEEHTSELQSPCNIVCRLLLEKKKKH